MIKLMGKKTFTILRAKILFISTYDPYTGLSQNIVDDISNIEGIEIQIFLNPSVQIFMIAGMAAI